MNHFALDYAKHVNKVLHDVLWSTWFYKLEVVEVPGLVTALLITYDNQKDDEFVIRNDMTWDQFLERMSRVKSDWAYFSIDIMKGFAEKPQKVMSGWEGRTIYFIKGGSNPEYWTFSNAYTDTILLLEGSIQMQGPMIQLEVLNVKESIRLLKR